MQNIKGQIDRCRFKQSVILGMWWLIRRYYIVLMYEKH